MANTVYSREELKKWFKNGMKPTENHFAAIFESFLHKTDTISPSSIDGLENLLELYQGLTREDVMEMIEQHNTNPQSHNIGTIEDFETALSQ